MINEVLGKNIRKHRLSRNWTQERLADVLRVSHQVISKWENGIAAPDIETLCSLKQIFCISLDELCGITAEKADILIEEMEKELSSDKTYQSLFAKWETIEKRLMSDPTNETLLYVALNYLRTMHDRIETDLQKNEVNEHILKIAERVLDFARNDSYRSYANYNLALYYSEQVDLCRRNEQDIANAKKAKMYADMVLYKDMHKTFYHSLGVTSIQEDYIARKKTLVELMDATERACINFIRRYKNKFDEKETTASDLWSELEELTEKLPILRRKLLDCYRRDLA